MLGWFLVDQARMLPGRGPGLGQQDEADAVRARVFLCLVVRGGAALAPRLVLAARRGLPRLVLISVKTSSCCCCCCCCC